MIAQGMLDVIADDLSDFVLSEFPLFSFPAVPPTGSAPSSGEPSDSTGDDAIEEVVAVSKVLIVLVAVEAADAGTKSLVGAIVVGSGV